MNKADLMRSIDQLEAAGDRAFREGQATVHVGTVDLLLVLGFAAESLRKAETPPRLRPMKQVHFPEEYLIKGPYGSGVLK